jgi:hypothetical protein
MGIIVVQIIGSGTIRILPVPIERAKEGANAWN